MALQKEVAAHLFMSRQRHSELVRKGILPPSPASGGYDIDEARGAYIRHLRGMLSGRVDKDPGADDAIDSFRERARKDRAQADKLEHELAIAKREYVHVSHHERLLQRFAERASAVVQSGAARVKNRLPHLKARELDVIRTEYAGIGHAIADIRPSTDARSD